jgi:pyruvate/2-oxoglutarate dehydrogenase complex dihydrolipoamide dehydrogenase (E3) component
MNQDLYDLVVIGAGSAGLVAGRFAAQLGVKVALVEKSRIGGDCTWTGCVPSKALIKAARIAHEVQTAHQYGVMTQAPTVDMTRVRAYVRRVIEGVYRFETPEALAEEGVEVILGSARFLDPWTIEVGRSTVKSKTFLIATGARATIPPIAGLEDVPFITYENIFDNEVLPKAMVVVGGGPLGIEMAQAYQRLGAKVTVVAKRILPKEDPDVQQLMQELLETEGIRFVLEPALSARTDNTEIVIATQHDQARGDLLVVAVGRKPNVDGLGLEAAGIKYSSDGIEVDQHLQTSIKHIYAAGDVVGSYQFTHYAGWQAFHAARNALLPGASSGVTKLVPRVTFTEPEVAHVGLTEQQAVSKIGHGVRIHRWDMNRVDRAVCENDGSGFIKLLTGEDGRILGATVVAARAGEAIVELITAMREKRKVKDLAAAIHPYPTYSTAIQEMSADLAVQQLLSGVSGKLIRKLSRIVR